MPSSARVSLRNLLDAELAMDFYRSRLRASADLHAAAAADFYRRQAAFDAGGFWQRRAPAATPSPPLAPPLRLRASRSPQTCSSRPCPSPGRPT